MTPDATEPEFPKSFSQKLRMDGRDYSRPGWYFVTLGADYHRPLFGAVEAAEMRPNALGSLVERCWAEIPQHYGHTALGAWQVMPNHFHGLVRITRACLETLQQGRARIVWVLPMAMPEQIPVAWTDAFLQQRALWLSAFPEDPPEATRASCDQANRWVLQFCTASMPESGLRP